MCDCERAGPECSSPKRFFAADIQASFCPEGPPFGWERDTHLYLSGPDLLGRVLSSAMFGTACAHLPAGGTLTPGAQGTVYVMRTVAVDFDIWDRWAR